MTSLRRFASVHDHRAESHWNLDHFPITSKDRKLDVPIRNNIINPLPGNSTCGITSKSPYLQDQDLWGYSCRMLGVLLTPVINNPLHSSSGTTVKHFRGMGLH